MRQSSASKRARGRSGGRRPYSNSANRTYDSSGPDVKIRGTASQIYEKYQNLARDASSSGDRIAAENYLQHAEHYFRILVATNASQAQNQPGNQPQQNSSEQPQPGYQGEGDGNGRARNNGRHPAAGSVSEEREDEAGGVIRTLSRSDESRTIAPQSSGPTSFEPVPDPARQEQPSEAPPAPLASEADKAADTEGAEESAEGKGGRKKGGAKEKSDAATAG